MNQQLVRIVSGVLTSLAAIVLGGCPSMGCTITPTNLGEIGFRTSWAFYHAANKEGPEDVTATMKVEAPAIVEWVTGKDKPEPVEP